jgi:ubiquinone/menaquinone biosynthesis C-methylase UbiE
MAEHVCPVWLGYFLASPFRRLFQNPRKILEPYVQKDMKVLDVGPGMGFFSLPLAQLVGPKGKVIGVDLQEKMLQSLERRARKAGLGDRIETRLCHQGSLNLNGLEGVVDFGLAFAVVHEVPDKERLFSEISRTLKATGRLLVVEPKMHVSRAVFGATVSIAEQNGFQAVATPQVSLSLAVLLSKK